MTTSGADTENQAYIIPLTITPLLEYIHVQALLQLQGSIINCNYIYYSESSRERC